MKKTYKIEVDCANCADKMEAAAGKVPGVQTVSVNFMAQRIQVEFEEGSNPTTVMEQILKVCKKVERDCTIDF